MKIPESEYTIQALIDKHHESIQEEPRPHMGASLLGHACDRWLWLSFRMAVVERFPGRILRLFRRGQDEEAKVVSDLRAIGMSVQNTGTNQLRVDFGCHVSGSMDGIIEYGVPEAPDTKHVLEIKTHSKKSFEDVLKNGVERSKPQHFVQMQVYMSGIKTDRALYVAICKDNDHIYTERVKLNKAIAKKAVDRGHRIVKDDRMPPPLSTDPTWFECRYCAAHEFCHKTKLTKEVNCRTCANSTAKEDGTWHCAHWDTTIPDFTAQLSGCTDHILHPDLVPWQHKVVNNNVTWITPEGDIQNGAKSANTFSSREIVANHKVCASPDEFIKSLRKDFGGEIF
jgi:hypothetical protein